MTYMISRNGEHLYVSREPTEAERNRFIGNGYTPPPLVREPDRDTYMYLRGEIKPNYALPSIYCHSLVSRLTDERSNETNMLSIMLTWYSK